MPNTLSVHYPERFSLVLIKNYDNNTVMSGLVNRELNSQLSRAGDTVHLRKLGDVTITPTYTAGNNATVSTVTSTTDSLVLNQTPYYHFLIDDLEQAQSDIDLVDAYTERAMIGLAIHVDSHLHSTAVAGVASGNVRGSASAAIGLTVDNIEDEFIKMGEILDEANIDSGQRVAVCPPWVCSLISKHLSTRETPAGDSQLQRNMLTNDFHGFTIYKTTNISATAGVWDILFFHKEDFIHHVMRLSGEAVKTYQSQAQFGTGVKGLSLYASKVFNTTAGALLKATK